MLNDFKSKDSTFPNSTQVVKHVVNEKLEHALHRNGCELRLPVHQNVVDNAQERIVNDSTRVCAGCKLRC